MKPRVSVLVVVLAAALLASDVGAQRRAAQAAAPAPKASTPAQQRERPVPFRAGEVLTYDVSWSSYFTAGVATMSVREARPSYGSRAYYIVGEGRPSSLLSSMYSLYYKADTLLDVYTLLPQRASLYSQEGKRRRMKVTRFDHAARTADYEVRTASVAKRTVRLPALVQDSLSAIYVLRAIRLKEGDRFAMPVCDGGANYRVMFNVGRVEPVKLSWGTVGAFRVTTTISDAQGRPVGRAMRLWISNDTRRLPVRLQAELAVGSFNLTLREAK